MTGLGEEFFAGPLGGLPHCLVRIVITDNGENFFALANLSGFLPRKDGGETWCIVKRLQIGFTFRNEHPALGPLVEQSKASLMVARQMRGEALFIVNTKGTTISYDAGLFIASNVVPNCRNEFANSSLITGIAANGDQRCRSSRLKQVTAFGDPATASSPRWSCRFADSASKLETGS